MNTPESTRGGKARARLRGFFGVLVALLLASWAWGSLVRGRPGPDLPGQPGASWCVVQELGALRPGGSWAGDPDGGPGGFFDLEELHQARDRAGRRLGPGSAGQLLHQETETDHHQGQDQEEDPAGLELGQELITSRPAPYPPRESAGKPLPDPPAVDPGGIS